MQWLRNAARTLLFLLVSVVVLSKSPLVSAVSAALQAHCIGREMLEFLGDVVLCCVPSCFRGCRFSFVPDIWQYLMKSNAGCVPVRANR